MSHGAALLLKKVLHATTTLRRAEIFENSTIITNSVIPKAFPKTKKAKNSKKNIYKNHKGSITLLPVFYKKYSLSIAGKDLGKIQIDIVDKLGSKVAGFELENVEYYILDLSTLPTGPYSIKINVLNQQLVHNIPLINLQK